MCRYVYFDHPFCGCRWLAIDEPCGPGMGFTTCPSFFNGRARRAQVGFATKALKPSKLEIFTGRDVVAEMRAEQAWSNIPCPVHSFGGNYDRNCIRLILDMQNGIRVGLGPDPQDLGVECRCNVM